MDRKKAIIGAATVAGSLLAASSAYALTSGILGNGDDDGAGNLTPVLDVAPPDGSPYPTSDQGDDDRVSVDVPGAGDDSSDGVEDRDGEDEHEDEDEDDDAVEPHEYEGHEDDD
jgi:hypothetical protein